MEQVLIGVREVALILGTSPAAIRRRVFRGQWDLVPKPQRLGSRVVWHRADIEEWLMQRFGHGVSAPDHSSLHFASKDKKRGRPRRR